MFQVRVHGRGGQGVVTAAELLSVAAFKGGRFAQAFPNFGSERTGAPVVSYCRISDKPIRIREPIIVPDALVIQDVTLLHSVDLLSGFPQKGYVIVNTNKSFEDLGLGEFAAAHDPERLVTVPATEIAMRHVGRPLPNAVLLGGLATMIREVSLEDVVEAISERFREDVARANEAGAREAYDHVSSKRKDRAHASTD
ncbi:MAG: 2-oxoacid:acceptor oxidoreductase family protein [Candidatus Nanopelagicales bacterium]|nr:2-oxoacid:acceptor oxidoreductase family protein [Candidatus Nanopelagicales bacterium]